VQAVLEGTVMVDDAVSVELLDQSEFRIRRRTPTGHRGLGQVPWSERRRCLAGAACRVRLRRMKRRRSCPQA
jgi:hypothetical protein